MTDTGTVWQCPQCSRSFSRVGQIHACETLPLDTHFQDSQPQVRKLFRNLVTQIERFGPVSVNPAKDGIHLQHASPFCTIKPRKRHLLVELMGDRNITDSIILKVTRPIPGRFVYTFHVAEPEDLNQKTLSWFKRAYQLAS
ncbi:MAG TPA: DUF5655 domain-containing protein [Acidobacteriota bacterium]